MMRTRVSLSIFVAPVLLCATLAVARNSNKKPSVVGTWHLVQIKSPGPDNKRSIAPQPTGMLIYTQDGHAAVQLMYPQTTLSNQFVHDGYEASFGSYEVDESRHHITYHVQASATREQLVGKSETLAFQLPDDRHMIIRPTDENQHWSVTWERY